jgi:hypothetical protein
LGSEVMWEMDSLELEIDERSESESDNGAFEADEMERGNGMSRGREFIRTSAGSSRKRAPLTRSPEKKESLSKGTRRASRGSN